MNIYLGSLLLAFIGLFIGSFAGAMVWRLRVLQLFEDEQAGEKVSKPAKKQVSAIKPASVTQDRSVCLHCGHQLAWYDLIPLVSWATLRGKCRYCHKFIGWTEPLIELSMAVFFGASLLFWPQPLATQYDVLRFFLWLVAGTGLAILTIYDARWFLLPNRVMYPLIAIGALSSFTELAQAHFTADVLLSIINGCLILSGLYYLIFVLSRHQWVGFGDVKLGLALALLLADWRLAGLALFLANAVGTLIVLPLMLSGRVQRGAHIPFGPLLISGWLFAGLFGQQLISWYLAITLGAA